jgi:protoporphyrin/coproporphyrin ferrochelatase
MPSLYDAVLLIAFGGPTSPEEIQPFLTRVLRGHSVPPQRIKEVVEHYMAVGGRSPLNELTFRQASALEKMLNQRGLFLPVYVGMRNSRPFVRETLDQMTADGVRRALGFILSPHQTEASWQRYQKEVSEAQEELGGATPTVDFSPGWHAHPFFIQALAEQIRPVLERVAAPKRPTTPIILTAHSVPTAMAAKSPYVEQIAETSRLVAEHLGHRRCLVAYQSRSGQPSEPWLEPDISDILRSLSNEGATDVVVAPIGFVCDHVEVLYDLDIAAKRIAESLGMNFLRASCVNDHPAFIQMMAEVIEASAKG